MQFVTVLSNQEKKKQKLIVEFTKYREKNFTIELNRRKNYSVILA